METATRFSNFVTFIFVNSQMRRKRELKNEDVFFESNSRSETESIENEETVDEKRLKLGTSTHTFNVCFQLWIAKDYLENLRDEFGDDEDQLKLHIDEKDTPMVEEIASHLEIPEDHLQSPYCVYHTNK